MGARRPLFRIDGPNWAIGFGVVLQMLRTRIETTLDSAVASGFDPNLAATGNEDVLITLSGLDQHRALATRPGNVTLASSDWRVRLYLDAVSLVDHPEYRLV